MSAATIESERRGFRAPGTTFMVLGGLIGAVGAYVFQVYGGRSLGTEEFAPVGVLWTSFFILATVLLVPVEQYVTREVASGRKALPGDLKPSLVMALVGSVLGGGFVIFTLDDFFNGDWHYAVQIVLLMVGYSFLFFGKGVLAGRRRFADVGWILIVETVVRLVAGIVAIQISATAPALGWAMVVGGFSVLGLRWWRHDRGVVTPSHAPAAEFMGGYAWGSASSQVLLGAAPIAVAALGADPTLVSVVFVTFTLFRAPMTLIFALQGRILPFLVGLSGSGEKDRLRRIATSVLVGGAVLALLGGLVGWVAGPAVVSVLFGPEFAPSAVVAMYAAGGMMAASAAQITGQVLVAGAHTQRLAIAWLGGLLAGVAVLLVVGGAPDTRVALSFASGECVALGLMAVMAYRS
jgi:O-antigen/teichoic acid export membrane protein